jgi:hypothetical protein
MSEYQYYEFRALDRSLTDKEMSQLRKVSTRADITPTSFTNHYDFGDFKGDPGRWMERYFDAFLYFANWNTRIVMLRVPRKLLDLRSARRYCAGCSPTLRSTRTHVILEFSAQEPEDECIDDGSGWLSAIAPARDDLAAGDLRLLYLGWLVAVQAGDVDDEALEPPVPAGLASLPSSLQAFAEFMALDPDLLAVAARESRRPSASPDLGRWLAQLPDRAKTRWLVRIAQRRDPYALPELLREFRGNSRTNAATEGRRTAGALRAAARLER